MRDLSRTFKALSEEHRLRIVAHLLRHPEVCVCEVEHFLAVSQSTASRHLRYLAAAELVDHRREGQWMFYRLAEPRDDDHRMLLDTLHGLLAGAAVADEAEVSSFRTDRCIGVSAPPGSAGPETVQVAE